MINPIQLVRMMNSGNPMQVLMSEAQRNPQLQQILQQVNGKTPEEMRQMAVCAAQQRGIDLNQLANQLGIRLPK